MRFAAAAFFALLVLPALAEDKAEIKVNEKKGLKFTRTTAVKGKGDLKVDGMGFGFEVEVEAEVERLDEVLESAKDGQPTTVHRQYTKQSATLKAGPLGEGERSGKLEMADLTIKSGGGSEGVGTSGKLSADDLKAETTGDALTAALASGKAMTAGQTWDADKDRVKAWVESELPGFKAEEGEMECKLGEFKEKDGQKCARIEITAKLKGKLSGDKGAAIAGTLTVKGDAYYSIDNGIVILVKAEGKLEGELENMKMNGQNMKATMNGMEWNTTVKVGEAKFAGPPKEKPKQIKEEDYPWPLR